MVVTYFPLEISSEPGPLFRKRLCGLNIDLNRATNRAHQGPYIYMIEYLLSYNDDRWINVHPDTWSNIQSCNRAEICARST